MIGNDETPFDKHVKVIVLPVEFEERGMVIDIIKHYYNLGYKDGVSSLECNNDN